MQKCNLEGRIGYVRLSNLRNHLKVQHYGKSLTGCETLAQERYNAVSNLAGRKLGIDRWEGYLRITQAALGWDEWSCRLVFGKQPRIES